MVRKQCHGEKHHIPQVDKDRAWVQAVFASFSNKKKNHELPRKLIHATIRFF